MIKFLEHLNLQPINYYTADDPTDFMTGNFDDDVDHGYQAGYNAAQRKIFFLLEAELGLNREDYIHE